MPRHPSFARPTHDDLAVRIVLMVDAAAYGSLVEDAGRTGTAMAEYLRRALELYFILTNVPPANDGPCVFGFDWLSDDWQAKYPACTTHPPFKVNFFLPVVMLERTQKLCDQLAIPLEEYTRRAIVTYVVLERMARDKVTGQAGPISGALRAPIVIDHPPFDPADPSFNTRNVLTFPLAQHTL